VFRCFGARSPFQSYQPIAGTRQRRFKADVLNAELDQAVSARALIHARFAQLGW
jgi:hypothetical protein